MLNAKSIQKLPFNKTVKKPIIQPQTKPTIFQTLDNYENIP